MIRIGKLLDTLGTMAFGAAGAFLYVDTFEGREQASIESITVLVVAVGLWQIASLMKRKKPDETADREVASRVK